ncbi:hypothetical protein [Lysobacter capsici]|uniref:hypothetical protein n=1 Tax=Lysobacter capsici TaxID=435897 RepID=UPI000445285F|nr:hypothetical protein [Lysobacter capsici]
MFDMLRLFSRDQQIAFACGFAATLIAIYKLILSLNLYRRAKPNKRALKDRLVDAFGIVIWWMIAGAFFYAPFSLLGSRE